MKRTIRPPSIFSYSYLVRSFDIFRRYVTTFVGVPAEVRAHGRVFVFLCVSDVFYSCHPQISYIPTDTISKGGAIAFALRKP